MSRESFRRELLSAINRNSMEGGSDTPDFILTDYLHACLVAFDLATVARTKWYAPPQPSEKTVTISRRQLEEAWKACEDDYRRRVYFEDLTKALGLDDEK